MTDRRRLASNGRVAAEDLRGVVQADRFLTGEPRMVCASVTTLFAAPGQRRDRQLTLGALVTVYEDRDGWSFLRAADDGYVGYVATVDLAAPLQPTHRVSTRATHAYTEASIKSPDLAWLPMGARLFASGADADADFARVTLPGTEVTAHVPRRHLTPLSEPAADPVAEAAKLLGTPYLWGGNSSLGIDCSGLIQIALRACHVPCPGDSDQQAAELGATLPPDTPAQRGDLLFWTGHVAFVADPQTILHANAHDMAVAYESLSGAINRIEAQGDGPVTRHARLAWPAASFRGAAAIQLATPAKKDCSPGNRNAAQGAPR